jgi:lysophospholipase L1-like esterase
MISRLRRAAQFSTGVALAGAATVIGTAGLVLAVLGVEGLIAARRRYVDAADAPEISGSFGDAVTDGPPALRLAVLGDSAAAGLGVAEVGDTVAGRLAALLAGTGRKVHLDGVGISGSRASDLGPQVSRTLLRGVPDIAVILIGANDAVHFSPPATVERQLGDAVRRLRGCGAAVVVGTCPDLGAARCFAQPLRAVMAWSGSRVARSSAEVVRRAGGVPVDLAARTGAVFRADPGTLSEDSYHPSADGYGLWALALYPAVLEAARSASGAGSR